MILYLDTSALVPLLVSEPSSELCIRIWDESETVIVTRLAYVEALAALAQAERLGRITTWTHSQARGRLETLWTQCSVYEIDAAMMQMAGELTRRFALRGYDAIHCAAGAGLAGEQVVAASGDRRLLDAWNQLGIATVDTNGPSLQPG